MKIVDEFKQFAMHGNVIDLAVGVIIGGAFGKIVTSFVNDILMPPIGLLLGGVNFSDLKIVMKKSVAENPAITFNYGNFLQSTVDFIIIAFVIFMMVKLMNSIKKKEEQSPEPSALSNEEKLLAEIRDLLKQKQS